MGLFILFRNYPWFHSIVYHIINYHSVPQVNILLDSKDTKDIKLSWGQIIKKVVKLNILPSVLDTFIYCDDKLVGFWDPQLPLCIYNSLNPWLDKVLLDWVEVFKVTLSVLEVMLKWSNWAFHVQYTFLVSKKPHGWNCHKVTHVSFCSYHS